MRKRKSSHRHRVTIWFKILRRYRDQIAEKTGNCFMTDNQVPPHMTISAIEARSVEVLLPVFESLEGKLKSGEISFVSVGELFPYVIYATPVLNAYLQEMQELVYDAVKDIKETTVDKRYRPYSWLPHVTLGKTLEKEQMQKAFAVMQEQFAPIRGKIVRIGLATVNPHRDVKIIEL